MCVLAIQARERTPCSRRYCASSSSCASVAMSRPCQGTDGTQKRMTFDHAQLRKCGYGKRQAYTEGMLSTSSATVDAMPGRVGAYVPARVIARGSLPVLYESEDPVTHRRVVLKTVRRDWPEVAADDILKRLRVEAEVARALNHPGIAAVYGYGEDNEHAYIAMECVEGRNLQHVLDSGAAI